MKKEKPSGPFMATRSPPALGLTVHGQQEALPSLVPAAAGNLGTE